MLQKHTFYAWKWCSVIWTQTYSMSSASYCWIIRWVQLSAFQKLPGMWSVSTLVIVYSSRLPEVAEINESLRGSWCNYMCMLTRTKSEHKGANLSLNGWEQIWNYKPMKHNSIDFCFNTQPKVAYGHLPVSTRIIKPYLVFGNPN